MQPTKIFEALRWASSFLEQHGLEQPIAEILLKHFLQVDRTKLFQKLQDELPPTVEEKLKKALEEVAKGVPVQHLTGVEFFYGREFTVNQHVLIPRPETEELVLGLLKRIDHFFATEEKVTVIDVGTGSGAIALTLALEADRLDVSTIDISPLALDVAKKNAEKLKANVRFLEGDLLSPIIAEQRKVDVVVSNPPYISESDFSLLEDNVRIHEPKLALVGGDTGYELYEKLISQLRLILNKKALIAFEVGMGQTKRVEALIKAQFPEAVTECLNDINGRDRVVFAKLQ